MDKRQGGLMDDDLKICNTCKNKLELCYFVKSRNSKDGYSCRCKLCDKQYREENRERINNRKREHYQENKTKILENHKIYYEKNKKKIMKQNYQYRKNNKEKVEKWKLNNREADRERHRIYYQKNKQQIAEKKKQYQKQNLDVWRKSNQKRRTKKLNLPASLTKTQWENVKQYFGYKCAYCERELVLQQDHFIPLSKGGEYTHNNIIPACGECNGSKNGSDFYDWYPNYKYYNNIREKKILNFLGYKGKQQQLSLVL